MEKRFSSLYTFDVKNFDAWNEVKKTVDSRIINSSTFFHEREVWWSSLGLNIGVESDGKNENYERPVLIIKKFNSHMVWVVPLTKRSGNNMHYHQIHQVTGKSWVILSQLKTMSTKRLLRKMETLSQVGFDEILKKISLYITNRTPPKGGVLGGRSH